MEVVPVRIGFEMLAVQSPHHGHRGIGRYSHHLVSAMLERGADLEFILYAHEDLPVDRIPTSANASLRWLRVEPEYGVTTIPQVVDHLARTNPDSLDVLVVLSPFEHWSHYAPPPRPLGNGLKLVSVVYDMIPFLFQQETVYSTTLMRFYRILEELRRYDALLAISEATRSDCRSLLRLSENRVVNIGAASDGRYFVPDATEPIPEAVKAVFGKLGITRPFVLNVGGMDERKNCWGLIDAFARLPEPLRRSHQLVLTFTVLAEDREKLYRHAQAAGVDDALVVTGEVTDEELRTLYQRCAAFVFPSVYEGFGLPILEAMHCGAAIVAGNNSSQIEVVGDAGLLANVSDPSDVAAKLESLLSDPELTRTLKEKAIVQAGRFSWERTADRALEVVRGLAATGPAPTVRIRADRGHSAKRRIAFFSPLPPRKSGVSDYSYLLLQELKRTYAIDLYHDSGYVPEPALASSEFQARDARLFLRYAGVEDYHAVVYQMGNSRYHSYLYETMLRVPGVVTLHDFCLAGFHLHFGHRRGMEREYIRNELLLWYPEHAEAIEAGLKSWPWDWETIARECAKAGWYLNRRLLASPNHVVVHSPWCVEQVRATSPEYANKMTVIPHGIKPRSLSPERRAAIRQRFDIPRDALMVASFGFIHPDKMNPEALEAFRDVAEADASALFVFVGEDADGGIARRQASSLGLLERVRFLGRTTIDDFADLASVTDIGINLRRPPTNGETSGALLYLLASGVATIVTDVATFSDYPSDAVRKVRWESEGIDGLRRALGVLARDRPAREALGQAAWRHVSEHHEWSRVAERYVDVIERCHDARRTARREARMRPPRIIHTPDASRPAHS
jgi:glycosyltransferase involved in cell wall biosynthesis